MASSGRLRITIHEASGLPKPSRLGGNTVYVQVRVDDDKCAKSSPINATSVTKFGFEAEVASPKGAKYIHLEVKRAGLLGKATVIAGCALPVAQLQEISNQSTPLWDPTTRSEAGNLLISIEMRGQGELSTSQGERLPGGLVNQATTVTFVSETSASNTPTAARSRGRTADVSGLSSATGSLVNHAVSGSFASEARGKSFVAEGDMGNGLVNYAGGLPDSSNSEPSAPPRKSLGGTALANQASSDQTGTRHNALPRAQEMLEALKVFSPNDEEHVRKLRHAVEELRHVEESLLGTKAGKAAFDLCCTYIEVLFQANIVRSDEKGANGALWLAGRLPSLGDDGEARGKVQESLRSQWDKVKMKQALDQSRALIPAASTSREELGELMDALDLAEFHASKVSGASISKDVSSILTELRPHLRSRLEALLKKGSLDEAEDIFDVIGSARIDLLKLRILQKELQQKRSVMLLRRALMPLSGEIGFSVQKQRQLRHAVMTIRTAMADDQSGAASTAVRNLLITEVLPATLNHTNPQTAVESTVAALQTVATLQLPFEEVWSSLQRPFEQTATETKSRLARTLPDKCKEWGVAAPSWLLSPELVECKRALRHALQSDKAEALQAALMQVKATQGGREACSKEWDQALEKLRAQHRLPEGWDVESMLAGQPGQAKQKKLLAKHEMNSGSMLALFDSLLKSTTHEVWTRDRHGKVPKSYTAVRAIEVRNAENWSTYLQRRDEIAKACGQLAGGSKWDEARDGSLLTAGPVSQIAQKTNAPALSKEANEVWLLHGTSHHAAEAISSQDFDMARASPTGLFGAGIYFAESISKSDEYVMGKVVQGKELFPVLICRVCLGHIYYCDEKAPDRKRLEERCIKDSWHSVLGDRKKISGTFREFVVYDNLQAFPAYIVYYTREY